MRNLLPVAALVFVLAACGGRTGAKPAETGTDGQEYATTVSLGKSDFLRKIANYESNPGEWLFLGDKPAIIDFYADWCGPCRNIAPILESLAQEYGGQIDIYKINVDNEQELSAVFRIQSIPSILFIPMEGQPRMVTGVMPKKDFVKVIETVLLVDKDD